MKKINGNLFLWVPIFVMLVLSIPWELIPKGVYVVVLILYGLYNFMGLGAMLCNYKGVNDEESCYYWDLDNWFDTAPIDSNYSRYTLERSYFRLGSVACWIIWIVLLINRWFNKHLTIKL